MAFRKAWKLEAAICKALGLDKNLIHRIVIDLQADCPPRVRISGWLTIEQDEALIKIFEATQFEELGTS